MAVNFISFRNETFEKHKDLLKVESIANDDSGIDIP